MQFIISPTKVYPIYLTYLAICLTSPFAVDLIGISFPSASSARATTWSRETQEPIRTLIINILLGLGMHEPKYIAGYRIKLLVVAEGRSGGSWKGHTDEVIHLSGFHFGNAHGDGDLPDLPRVGRGLFPIIGNSAFDVQDLEGRCCR